MKLQAKSSKELNKALSKAAKCIATKNVLPILDNVLLSLHEDGRFYFTSSTGDAQLTIPAPLTIFEGQYTFSLALPISLITSFLATLPDCVVTLNFAEDPKTLTFEYCTGTGDNIKKGEVNVAYYDGKDFPVLLPVQATHTHIVLPFQTFENVVAQASNFIKPDEFRPQLSCLCIDIAEDLSDVVFVGTDTNRLYKHTLSNDPSKGGFDFHYSGDPCQMLLPMRYFRVMSAFDGCEIVDIKCDGRSIYISCDDIELICKTVEQKYPNYKSVIPRENPYFVCVDKKEMLAVLKRVSLFGDKCNFLVEVEKDGMFVNISARDMDFGTAASDQVIISDAKCDEYFRIGFNAQSLTAALNALPDGTVRIQMSAPSRAAVITADVPAPDTLALCSPMLLP